MKKKVFFKGIILFLILLFLLVFTYQYYGENNDYSSVFSTEIGISIALFSFISIYLIQNKEVQIDINTKRLVLIFFILVNLSNIALISNILSLAFHFRYTLIITFFIHNTLVLQIIYDLFRDKVFKSEAILLKKKIKKSIKTLDTNDGEKIKVISLLDELENWIDSNKRLKNPIDIKAIIDSYQEIIEYSIKRNYFDSINDKDEFSKYLFGDDIENLFDINLLFFVIRFDSEELLGKLTNMYNDVNAILLKVNDFNKLKSLHQFLYSRAYEISLQMSKSLGKEIVSSFVHNMKSIKNDAPNEYKDILFDSFQSIIIQMHKYDYSVDEFSMDYLFQESILNNNSLWYDDKIKLFNLEIFNFLLFTLSKSEKSSRSFIRLSKVSSYILTIDSIEDVKTTINGFVMSLVGTSYGIEEFLDNVFVKLMEKFVDDEIELLNYQIMIYKQMGSKFIGLDLNRVLRLMNYNYVDNNDVYQRLRDNTLSYIFRNNDYIIEFFESYLELSKELNYDNEKLKKLLKTLSVLTLRGLIYAKKRDITNVLIGAARIYDSLLDDFSKDYNKNERNQIIISYFKFLEDFYIREDSEEIQKRIIGILFEFIDSNRSNEKKQSTDFAFILGFRALESQSLETIKSVSNYLGWALLKEIRKIDSGNKGYTNILLKKIIEFFKLVVKFCDRKTAIFMGTLFLVNYIECSINSIKPEIFFIKDTLKNFTKNLTLTELKILSDSFKIRLNFVKQFFENSDESILISKGNEYIDCIETQIKKIVK